MLPNFSKTDKIILLLNIFALLLSFTNSLDLPRIIVGHLFVYLTSGYFLSKFLFPKTDTTQRFFFSSLLSILLTYPVSVITTIIEGQSGSAIFERHLHLSISILFAASTLFALIKKASEYQQKEAKAQKVKFSLAFYISLIIFSFLTLTNINRADIYGDEYDMGYQAYNLVDGILAGRKAFVVSFSGHPPLTMSLKHFSLNLLSPEGLDYLSDWHFRFSEYLIGLFLLGATYAFTYKKFGQNSANFATLITSSSMYFLWMGNIFHREMLLTYLLMLVVYFLSSEKNNHKTITTGVTLVAALLVKMTALLIIPTIILFNFLRKQNKQTFKILLIALLFLTPVIIYNIVAYKTTGYADVFFSNIFGVYRPGSTLRSDGNIIRNLYSAATYLIDLFSPIIFILLILSLVLNIKNKNTWVLISWILSGILFFTLTSIRSYYFFVIFIPVIVLFSITLASLKYHLIRNVLFALILFYSLSYTLNTFQLRNADIKPNGIDGSVVIPTTLFRKSSLSPIDWTQNYGFKSLISQLDKNLKSDECVKVHTTVNTLLERRYFWTNDPVKSHYLNLYPSRYPLCTPDHNSQYIIYMDPQDNKPEFAVYTK